MLSKQKTQPDGDEEPCQYGLCCDACRAEGEDTRLLEDGGGKDCLGRGHRAKRSWFNATFWRGNLSLINETLLQTASLF